MYCLHCGTNNPDGAIFCAKCGKPITPTPNTATQQYSQPAYNQAAENNQYSQRNNYQYTNPYSSPAIKPAAASKAIGTAIVAIIAVIMFFLPWLDLGWGFTMNYIDLYDTADSIGYYSSDADAVGIIMLICLIAYGILAIISVVNGFRGTKTGCGIAAGILGIIMVAALIAWMEFEFEIIGFGVYLFLAANILLIIMSALKK